MSYFQATQRKLFYMSKVNFVVLITLLMKAVAYSVLSLEKEFIAKANRRKHEITLIANSLNMDTIQYAAGKAAVIIPENLQLSGDILHELATMGIKYIIPRSSGNSEAELMSIANQIIIDLDKAGA